MIKYLLPLLFLIGCSNDDSYSYSSFANDCKKLAKLIVSDFRMHNEYGCALVYRKGWEFYVEKEDMEAVLEGAKIYERMPRRKGYAKCIVEEKKCDRFKDMFSEEAIKCRDECEEIWERR